MEQVIKSQKLDNTSVIELIKNEQPIFGGLYSVRARTRDYISHEKNGLCLDAAIEVYNKSLNYSHTTKLFSSIGK